MSPSEIATSLSEQEQMMVLHGKWASHAIPFSMRELWEASAVMGEHVLTHLGRRVAAEVQS